MRNLENTPLSINQRLVMDVINDYRNWQPPGVKIIKELTGLKYNKSIVEAKKSLAKRGLLKSNPFLPKLYINQSR